MNDLHYISTNSIPCLMLQNRDPHDNEILVPVSKSKYRGKPDFLVMHVNARCLQMPRFRGCKDNMILENLEKLTQGESLNNHQLLTDVIVHTFETIPVNSYDKANGSVVLVKSKNFESSAKGGFLTIATPLTIEVLLDGLRWLSLKDPLAGNNQDAGNFSLVKSYFRTEKGPEAKQISSLPANLCNAFQQCLELSPQDYTNIVTVEFLFRVYLRKMSVSVPSMYWNLDEMEQFARDHDLLLTQFPDDFDTLEKRVAYMQHFYRKIPENTKVMISIVDGQHRCQSWWYIHNHVNPSICKAQATPKYDETVDKSMSTLFEQWKDGTVPMHHQHLEQNELYVKFHIPPEINDDYCTLSQGRSKALQWSQSQGHSHDFSTFVAECIDKLSSSDDDSD